MCIRDSNAGPIAAPLDGGPARRLMTTNNRFVEELAVDSTSVYFTDGTDDTGVVRQCARSGCGDAGLPIATKQEHPRQITVDAKSIYWVNEGDVAGAVMRLAK